MNNAITTEMFGVESVLRKISEIDNFTADKEVRKGLKQGGRHLIKKGRQRLKSRMKSGPKGVTGNLLRSFRAKVKRNNAGVITGFKGGKGGGNHSWLVDKGTTKKRTTRKGYNRGRVKGNKYWSETRANDTGKAMQLITDGLDRAISKLRSR